MRAMIFSFVDGAWKKHCNILFFLTTLASFFLLPLHSDPSIPIVLSMVLGLLASRKISPPSGLPRYAIIAFIGFALVALAASLHSMETLSKYPGVLLWGCALTAGILFSQLYPEHQYSFLLATAFAILLSLCIAAVQGFEAPQFWHDRRLKLLAMHPSRLALYCVVPVFFCLYRAVMGPRLREKMFYLTLLAVMLACLYLTNTRGVILALPLGILCLVPAFPPAYRKACLAAFLVLCLLTGACFWATKEMPLSRRVVSVITNPTNDPTFRSRLPLWEVAWESFKEAPFIGYGVKSYPRLHAEYLAKHKLEWDEKYAGSYESQSKAAHNIILGRLVESGILGTLCFVFFYMAVIVEAFKLPMQQRLIAAFFVFYMVSGIFDDSLFRRNDTFIFFLAGTVLGAMQTRKI